MTDTLPAGVRGAAPSPAPGRTPLPWLRKHRALTALCAVVAVALGLVVWGQLAPRGDAVPLSPGNAGPDGARAVTQILGRHGVDVHTAGTFEGAMAALGEVPQQPSCCMTATGSSTNPGSVIWRPPPGRL
ncbi:hypothetical protein [Arthrobacter sp. SD76]|uniref:hypothetical protein n=1 Tax=Arthrobacter sp. SD76 TaxID=3415007 RepID=UPI003C738D13